MSLSVINRTKAVWPRAPFFGLWPRARRHFPVLAKKSVDLAFISPPESLRINSRYRGRRRATNVLSFKSEDTCELGDILLCPAAAKTEARAAGVKLEDWLAYLFIHGLLHLLGFDHQTKKQEQKMEKAGQAILSD